jgi:hypothetical protein
MSYCRWSSDNFKCDLYVYEDCGGFFSTSVATHRIVGDIPTIEFEKIHENPTLVAQQYEAQMNFLHSCQRIEIGLPYDGESFCDFTLEELRDRLLHLKETGYRFPESVLEKISAEIKERGE